MMIRNIACRNYVLILGGIKNIAHSFFLLVFVFFAGSAMALDLGGMLKKIETVAGEQSAPVEKRETAQEQHESELNRLREAEKERDLKNEERIKRYEIAKQKEEAEREERRIAHQKEQEKKAAADKIAQQKEEENQKKKLDEESQKAIKIKVQHYNKLFAVLKSPELNKAYTVCKDKEVVRVTRIIQANKEDAKKANTTTERDNSLKQVSVVENNLHRISPALCWVQLYSKSRNALNITYGGGNVDDLSLANVADALDKKYLQITFIQNWQENFTMPTQIT